MNDGWRAGRVVPVEGPFLVANTHADAYPRLRWGGPDDGFLVLSDAPEFLDDTNLGPGPATLYADVSGAIRGACRVLLFHVNRTRSARRLGITVRNMGAASGRLTHPAAAPQAVDTNGVRAGVAASRAWLDSLVARPVAEPLAAGAMAVVLDRAVAPGECIVALVPVALHDDAGEPLPFAVQTWAAAAGASRGRAEDTWAAPLAPWQTETNTSSKIRATVPHGWAQVTLEAAPERPLFLDFAAMSPSGGPGASPGSGDPGPAGFPLPGRTAEWLAPGHAQAETARPWPYQSDPAGFDASSPASEYVAGWDDADQRAEGVADPPSRPAFWYRSKRYGVWMRQWNYGEYGAALDITIRSEAALSLAVTPAREKHACPWVWHDPARGRTDGVPWEMITGGRLGTHYGGASSGYVLASGPTEHRFVTTVTPGAYAPYRVAIVPGRR